MQIGALESEKSLLVDSVSNTRSEVVSAVEEVFPGRKSADVLAVLDEYGIAPHERERERVQLAIVGLSNGDEERVRYFVKVAKTDYRDILSWQATGPLTPEEGKKAQDAARELMKRWGKS